jgi:hypothetical protein
MKSFASFSSGLNLVIYLAVGIVALPQSSASARSGSLSPSISHDSFQAIQQSSPHAVPIYTTGANPDILPPEAVQQLHITYRKKQSSEYVQTSSNDDPCRCDHYDIKYSLSSDVGWHLLLGRSTLIETASRGDYSKHLISEDHDAAVWSLNTAHHQIGTSGRVVFKLQIIEYQ